MVMNVRFEYLYRDAGNFKNWGEVVITNPRQISVELITAMAEKVLIDQAYFVASKANIPDLHFAERVEELDHDWHEVDAFQTTDEAPNDPQGRDVEGFIESLQCASRI
jgi:hypothetical protein